MARKSANKKKKCDLRAWIKGPLRESLHTFPPWAAALAGVGAAFVILVFMPFLLRAAVSKFQPEGWLPDWFSFYSGWIPGVTSAIVGIISILMAVKISREQSNQNDHLNRMQTSLTMAMNLPSLHISRVELLCQEEFRLEGHPLPGMGRREYQLKLYAPLDAFPAYYGVNLASCSWTFYSRDGKELHTSLLDGNHASLIPAHTGQESCLMLDFDCVSQDKNYFQWFYYYPDRKPEGVCFAEVRLELLLENRLLFAFLRNAGLCGDGVEPSTRIEVRLRLRSWEEFASRRGGALRAPEIRVKNYNVSVL